MNRPRHSTPYVVKTTQFTWTDPILHSLLDFIQTHSQYQPSFFQPENIGSSESVRVEQQLCIDFLGQSDWMKGMITQGTVIRDPTNGRLKVGRSWDGDMMVISRLFDKLHPLAERIKSTLGPLRSRREVERSPSAMRIWDQWQERSKQTWYFKYLDIKLRFYPYWLRPDNNRSQNSLASRISHSGPTLPITPVPSSSSRFKGKTKYYRTSRPNLSISSQGTNAQRRLPLPVVRLPPVTTEHLEAIHQQEKQESIWDDEKAEADNQGCPSLSDSMRSDTPDVPPNTGIYQDIEDDPQPLLISTININDVHHQPTEAEELASPLFTSSNTSATMVNTSPHAIHQDQAVVDVALSSSAETKQDERLVLVLLDMIIQEREATRSKCMKDVQVLYEEPLQPKESAVVHLFEQMGGQARKVGDEMEGGNIMDEVYYKHCYRLVSSSAGRADEELFSDPIEEFDIVELLELMREHRKRELEHNSLDLLTF